MERKYAMTKMPDGGGWLLLSNDARHLYRLAKYEEDGSASWTDADGKEHPIVGWFWGFQCLTREGEQEVIERGDDGTIRRADLQAAEAWSCWDWVELMMPTRNAAEAAALAHGEVRT